MAQLSFLVDTLVFLSICRIVCIDIELPKYMISGAM